MSVNGVRESRHRIRPSGFGRSVAILGGVSAVLGVTLSWIEFTVIAVFVVALVVVSIGWVVGSRRWTAHLRVEPSGVTRGETAFVFVEVGNHRRSSAAAIDVDLHVGSDRHRFAVPRLARGQQVTRTFTVATRHRGVVQVGPMAIVRRDPFGLLHRHDAVAGTAVLFVRPAIDPLERIDRAVFDDLDSGSSNRLGSAGGDFHLLRDYVPGDDRRHVHWRTSARVGHQVVRQFTAITHRRMTVVLDIRAWSYQSDEAFEQAVSIVASLVVARLRLDIPVAVRFGEVHIPSATVDELLDACAAVATESDPSGRHAAVPFTLTESIVVVGGARTGLGAPHIVRADDAVNRIIVRVDGTTPVAVSRSNRMADAASSIDVQSLSDLERVLLELAGR